MDDAFFALIGSGLFGTELTRADIPADLDWSGVLDCARRQTVTGTLAEAVGRLHPELQPPAAVMAKLQAFVVSNMATHRVINSTLAQTVRHFAEQGVATVLLKGQGVARCYPVPEMRQCGDIDLYVGDDNYHRACAVASERWFGPGDETAETAKHFEFNNGKVSIELHRKAALMTSWRHGRAFNKWLDAEMRSGRGERQIYHGVEVQLPPTETNIIFVFFHAWHHFLTEGVGLRQLCDIAMMLHRYAGQYDADRLTADLRRHGLACQWQLFGYIIVNRLGLPADEMPLYTDSVAGDATMLLDEIMRVGNFGHYNPDATRRKGMSFLRRKLSALANLNNRLVFKMRFDAAESLGLYLTTLQASGCNFIKQTIKQCKK